MIYVRTQKDLLGQLAMAMRDTTFSRYTKAEMVAALNEGIRGWAHRVRVPFVHTLSTNWSSTSFTKDLPSYVEPEFIRPQILSSASPYEIDTGDSTLTTYVTLPGWVVEPSGSGGWTVRLTVIPHNEAGRILFWKAPGELPGDIQGEDPTVNTDSTTSITIDTPADNLPDVGYLRIGSEWMQYAGAAWDGSTWTLSNLVRALFGTTQAAHSSSDSVYWGLPVDRLSLYNQLIHQAQARLYELYLNDASVNEREQVQWNARWFQQKADEYWVGYFSSWEPMVRINTRTEFPNG